MAFVADVRMIANVWLRPGNTGSANNVIGFLHATREHLAGKAIGLLRADSGFCEPPCLRRPAQKVQAGCYAAQPHLVPLVQ